MLFFFLSKFQLADIDILSILIKHNMLIICTCIVLPFIVPLYICSCSSEMEDNKSLSNYVGLVGMEICALSKVGLEPKPLRVVNHVSRTGQVQVCRLGFCAYYL